MPITLGLGAAMIYGTIAHFRPPSTFPVRTAPSKEIDLWHHGSLQPLQHFPSRVQTSNEFSERVFPSVSVDDETKKYLDKRTVNRPTWT